MRHPERSLAAVAVGWGTIGVIVNRVGLPAVVVAASRVAIGSAGLGAWLAVSRARVARAGARPSALVGSRRMVRWLILNGVLLAGHWTALFAAEQRAPIGVVLLVVYLGPVVVAMAAPRLLHERVSRSVVLALVVAVVGTLLVVGPGGHGISRSGLLLAAVAGISYAGLMLAGKPLAERVDPLVVAFGQQLTAAVVLVPFALGSTWGPPKARWLWLLVLGLVHTAAGMVVFFHALARMPATAVGTLGYLEPAAAVFAGWVFLSQTPSWAGGAGGLLIVVAGLIVIRTGSLTGPVSPEVAGAG